MEIKNTDLFLINSGGLSYKVQARNLQESTGTLLVNRGGSSYKCSVSDVEDNVQNNDKLLICLLYTSPSPRDRTRSRMPSSA